METEKVYDVAVIGGGPGGYVCAIRCAQLGRKTILVEKDKLGGTCLNRGCVPTKSLLHTAEIYHELLTNGSNLGINTKGMTLDYAATFQRKTNIVEKLRAGIESLLVKRKITIVKGEARLTGTNSFSVGESEYLVNDIVIATGSEPSSIPVKGIDKAGVLNSDQVLSLQKLPDSAIIIGGGVIGVEIATLLNAFQKKVSIIELLPRILHEFDEDISKNMSSSLIKKGVEIYTDAKLIEIQDGLKCVFEKNGKQDHVSGEIVIMAVGRRPVIQSMNLDNLGIKTDRNYIFVNEKMQTSVENIYAIGDVTGKVQLAHVASAQGIVAAANISHLEQEINYNIIPTCVYTNPEIASIGLTESQVKGKGIPYKIGLFNTKANARCMIMNCDEGFVKVITQETTGEILGAHIMAPRATDLIGEIAIAMKAEATIEELSSTIHAHPTISEMIMEAAHDVHGLSCHK